MFRMTGCRVVSELQSVADRSDVVVSTKDSVFIFELKIDKGRAFEDFAVYALIRIDANGYVDRFAVSGKKVSKVGVVFFKQRKGNVRMEGEVESLTPRQAVWSRAKRPFRERWLKENVKTDFKANCIFLYKEGS